MTDSLGARVVGGMLERDAFSRWLGIELLELVPGRVSCRLTVRDEMLNGFGVAHGAIAYALADSALAFASNQSEFVTVSIENSMTYPAPIRSADVLVAEAEEEARTQRLAYFRVTVCNQRGTKVALFRGTVYRTSEKHELSGIETQTAGSEP